MAHHYAGRNNVMHSAFFFPLFFLRKMEETKNISDVLLHRTTKPWIVCHDASLSNFLYRAAKGQKWFTRTPWNALTGRRERVVKFFNSSLRCLGNYETKHDTSCFHILLEHSWKGTSGRIMAKIKKITPCMNVVQTLEPAAFVASFWINQRKCLENWS